MSADVAYLDTSAFVKLVALEPESAALQAALRAWPRRASSALLRVEALRTLRRVELGLVEVARRMLAEVDLIGIDNQLLEVAARLSPPELRSVDAVHLASALTLAGDLGAVVTYDSRLSAAATHLGLTVLAPR